MGRKAFEDDPDFDLELDGLGYGNVWDRTVERVVQQPSDIERLRQFYRDNPGWRQKDGRKCIVCRRVIARRELELDLLREDCGRKKCKAVLKRRDNEG